MSPLEQSRALHRRVRAAIESCAHTRGSRRDELEPLALDIARHQAEHVAPVARIVRARGLDPSLFHSIDDLPALPTDVFRLRRVAAHEPSLDERVFRTSGTTSGAELRGAHPMRELATYRAAALAWGEAMLLGAPRPTAALVLAPSAAELGDSSLSFMIDLFVEHLGLQSEHLVSLERGLDLGRLEDSARRIERNGEVALVLGTAFAFVHAIDALSPKTWRFPDGSRAMLTGGFKGRSRVVPEAELREGIERLFGLPGSAVVGEYGMTELSSQLYEPRFRLRRAHVPGLYEPPPWLWVSAVCPDTLAPLPPGEEGIARFVDLANVDSSIAIQTHDLVRVAPDGTVQLLGRLPGSIPRGCSIAMDELLSDGS